MTDPATVYQACAAVDFDAATGVCSHVVWLAMPSFLPDLDVSSGITIGTAILGLWAVAYGYRALRRSAD